MSEDFLGNIAMLTHSLQQLNTSRDPIPTSKSRIDLSGTENINFCSNFDLPIQKSQPLVAKYMPNLNFDKPSNITYDKIPVVQMNPTPVISTERRKETDRLLSLDPVVDIHGKFKVDIKELLRIEDLIKEYNQLIKQLRAKKTKLKNNTINHMVKHDLEVATMPKNDKFTLVKVKSKLNPTTKARLPINLTNYFIQEENFGKDKAHEL